MDQDFPVKMKRFIYQKSGPIFESHWHEQFQILYFERGEALIHCNSQPLQIHAGDVVIINRNDVHYGENVSQELAFYLIKLDLSFLLSNRQDLCQTKYVVPIMKKQVVFRNYISRDEELVKQIQQLINEYYGQETGFELAIKAYFYRILALLLRRYREENAGEAEQGKQCKSIPLRPVLEYVDQHYCERLTLEKLASMANVSSHHFCRMFKKVTGKPPIEYINYLRINRAATLLQESNLNISEIAMTVGFDDSNYFSRLFKKYKQASPSKIRTDFMKQI
jgi:AraC-like DNA-binding protein